MEEGVPIGTEVTQVDETCEDCPSKMTTGNLGLTDHPAGKLVSYLLVKLVLASSTQFSWSLFLPGGLTSLILF